MTRRRGLSSAIAVLSLVAAARAAPASPGPSSAATAGHPQTAASAASALPAGHPPIAASAASTTGHPPVDGNGASALPAGHPPIPADSAESESPHALPPGHPAVADGEPGPSDADDESDADETAMPAGHPAMDGSQVPKDSVTTAPDLRPGTIEVHVADPNGAPLTNIPLRLGLMREDVATGNSKEERNENTDSRGVVTFGGLPTSTDYSYRATVDRGIGVYASEPFRLDERAGKRVLLHVYPVTRDIRQALVGMRGVVYVQPREDIFQIETTIQVLNIGAVAWVPDQVHIELPDGAKAFRANESMQDTRVERDKSGEVSLLGTFSPGEHEITFQYQIDNPHEPTQRFRMGLPPHVAEMRVYAEGPRGMQLSVSGFPPAERTTAQNGSHLLATGKRASRGGEPLDDIDVSLENLPVPSQGRWYAAILALCVAAFGVWNGFSGRRTKATTARRPAEFKEAEGLVLDELVELERLERSGEIGPRAYAEARGELLDALSRLSGQGNPAPG